MKKDIRSLLKPESTFTEDADYYEFPVSRFSESFKANSYYFNQKEWAAEYLRYCHREETFKDRWLTAAGDWAHKTVIDIGCGPGNIFANFIEKPDLLIGIDIAPGSLISAGKHGYTPVLADAHDLPFKSEIADLVTLNAALHHCEDMQAVLIESARLVKPGGLLITDHDPQLSAWNYKGLAKLLWYSRLLYYRLIGRGFHKSEDQQFWGLACETHHKPGDVVSENLFQNVLKPLGFTVKVFPHNHDLGAEIFMGQLGKASFKYRLGNLLSGRNPDAAESALTLMCVARKNLAN